MVTPIGDGNRLRFEPVMAASSSGLRKEVARRSQTRALVRLVDKLERFVELRPDVALVDLRLFIRSVHSGKRRLPAAATSTGFFKFFSDNRRLSGFAELLNLLNKANFGQSYNGNCLVAGTESPQGVGPKGCPAGRLAGPGRGANARHPAGPVNTWQEGRRSLHRDGIKTSFARHGARAGVW